jgi:hypothetical protein
VNERELDDAIRRIAGLTREVDGNHWRIAEELASMTAVEYERAIGRLVQRTGWTRNRLTIWRQTGLSWPAKQRLSRVPFDLHRRFRYDQDALRAKAKAGKLGAADIPATNGSRWSLSTLARKLDRVAELITDTRLSDAEVRAELTIALSDWLNQ